MIPMWTLGERLRKARTSAGLEKEAMASLFFRHRNTIVNWEGDRARPTEQVLRKWAEVTDVPIWWLHGEQEPAR
jgi:transcriptional regulator with XRE-family HTH domain